jgi:protein gp37
VGKTKIEWTDASWNPIRARVKEKIGPKPKNAIGWYCEHVSDGCTMCYAERINQRLGTGLPFKPGHRKDVELFLDEQMLTLPLRWKKPRMIFVCSMTDMFADFVPDEWIDRMFAVMALCPQHTFQVLTKRTERMRDYLTDLLRAGRVRDNAWEMHARLGLDIECEQWPLPNVWLGFSAEDQENYENRWRIMREIPAAVRFCSYEPALGPLRIFGAGGETGYPSGLGWLICGGESGPGYRHMEPEWEEDVRRDCARAGVPYFFKQQAGRRPIPGHFPLVRQFPNQGVKL